MAQYLIVYRLHRQGQQYEALYAGIKSISGTYWHNTTSSWIVETALTAKQIYQHLERHIDGNDELAVFALGGAYYGQLQPSDLRWIASRSGLYVSA